MAPLWNLMDEANNDYRLFDDHFTALERPSLLSASILNALCGEYRELFAASLESCKVWMISRMHIRLERALDGIEYKIGPTQPYLYTEIALRPREFLQKRVAHRVEWASWSRAPDDWVPRTLLATSDRRYSDPTLIIGFSNCHLTDEARTILARHVLRRLVAECCWAWRNGKIVFSRSLRSNSQNFPGALRRLSEFRSDELRKAIITFL